MGNPSKPGFFPWTDRLDTFEFLALLRLLSVGRVFTTLFSFGLQGIFASQRYPLLSCPRTLSNLHRYKALTSL